MKRVFVAYYNFNSWLHFSLGVHVCFTSPNLEVHVPFGFFRIGWSITFPDVPHFGEDAFRRTTWGLLEPKARYQVLNDGSIVDMHHETVHR